MELTKIEEVDSYWLKCIFTVLLLSFVQSEAAFTESDIERVKCGHIDNCNSTANYTAGGIGIERYSEYPFYCRCDPGSCAEYSECCPSARNEDLKLAKPLVKYSCRHVPEMDNIWTGILMVDYCPEGSDAGLETRCLGEVEDYQYTLDMPAHSTRTRRTYRNVYCGLCNGEKAQDFSRIQTYVACKNKTSELNMTDYLRSARQESPRKFVSTSGDGECQLRVLQLTPKSQVAQARVSAENGTNFQLHYCRTDQITECPQSYNDQKVADLCSAYKQPVLGADRKPYKNPHCYLCNIPPGSQARPPKCDRTKDFYPRSLTEPNVRSGLNLVFDFSFSSTSAVGSRDICAPNEIWDYIHEKCQAIQCPADFRLINHVCVDTTGGGQSSNLTVSSQVTTACNWIVLKQHINVTQGTNDSINIQLQSETHTFGPNEYKRHNESTISVCISTNKSTESAFSSLVSTVSDICLGISIVLSFVHLTLFVLLRALRTFAKKILACITLSIFMSQLLFLTMLQTGRGTWVCATVGIVLHYFFLSSFTWMTTMAFDIHRKFSGSMLSGRHQTRSGIRRTFVKYSLFAWLAPLVFIGFGTSIDYLPPLVYPDQVAVLNVLNKKWTVNDAVNRSLAGLEDFQPAYGQGLCWFNNRLALLVLFGAPVAVLIGSNCVFFGLAAWSILSQNRKAQKVLKKAEAQTEVSDGSKAKQASWEKHNQVNVRMYGKLALIMGVTWVLGFVANLAQQDWIWLAFVVLNGLQGTLIFCGFDVRRRTWQLCKRRFAKSWCGKLFPSFGVEESSSRNLSSKDRTFSTRTSSNTLPSRKGAR